jgi:NAD(P)-dependent dehydrogenase (short-subunit alcohol dehydrogenase family)
MPIHTYDFAGKVAVVTGGSGVLCGPICRALATAGAEVVIVGHSHLERGEGLAAEINAGGAGRAIAVEADVLNRDSVKKLADRTFQEFGRTDFLINGAGGARPDAVTSKDLPFADLPADAVRWVFDLNFLGTFFAAQIFLPILRDQAGGAVLNISSMGALRPLTRSVAYSAAKAAVSNFTQWLAVHASQNYHEQIRVNALVPGFFLTRQNRFLLQDEESGEWTERGGRILEHTPMGRFGQPEDLTGAALWLLSEEARFVHGTSLIVDGGMSAYGGV